MEFQLEEAIDILHRTPETLRVLLKDLPPAWATNNEGEATWSPYDVVGHLIHGEETDWMPRARIILEHGEAQAFPPFDRFAQVEKSQGKPLNELLDEFAVLRRDNLAALAELHLEPEQLSLRGTHPDANLGSVTLSELLATWVAHDLSHVAQILRVMCRQYSEAVGPWKQYLPLVNTGKD
ncbi:MAG: hypothetical protein V7641_5146 [Blastocatellia bacterium]